MTTIILQGDHFNPRARDSERVVVAIGALLFIAFFLISLRTLGSFTQDESQYHYPNLLNYVQNGWMAATFNARYSAANTPLPYLLVAAAAKVFGPSLLLARLVTVIVSFLTFVVAVRLLKGQGAAALSVFSLALFPYFFASSFVFYAVNYGLLFLLLALLVLHRMPSKWHRDAVAGSLLAAAVLCQQFYLVVPFAVLLHRLWESFRQPAADRPALAALGRIAMSGVPLLLPLTVPMALFVAWGGLTHPNFRVHSIALSPTNITGMLFVIGFYFLPYLAQMRSSITWPRLAVALLVAVGLVTWVRPEYSDLQGPGLFTGLVFHLIHVVQSRQPALGLLLMGLLVMAGALTLTVSWSAARTPFQRLLLCVLAMLTVPYWMSTEIGERHLLGFVTLLFILVLPQLRPTRVAWLNGYVGAVGLGYFFYWMFFKFN